jgi:hypothetical protein
MFNWPLLREFARSHEKRPLVTIAAVITRYDADEQDDEGALHQIIAVRVTDVVEVPRGVVVAQGDEVRVIIRYGDSQGLPERIADPTPGEPIEVCGVFIPAESAYTRPDEAPMDLIHFTHRPLGWVKYRGRTYR